MVKKLGIALLCAALGSTLHARDDISKSELFIGLELGSTKAESSTELFTNNAAWYPKLESKSDSVIEYGVRIGAEKEDWRTTLLYTYYNNDDAGFEETMHKGSILLDYFIWSSGTTAYDVKPYIGAHVGYVGYTLSGPLNLGGGNTATATWADDSGLFYGGQAGVAMTMSDVIQLDLSYRYSLTTLDNIEIQLLSSSPNRVVTGLDNMGSFVFSVNYFY